MKSKLFYITTPIFYVNAAPHIGHFYSACIADCAYRYEKLQNRALKYRFSTGTDEHGTKVQQAAALHNQAPHVYCDQITQKYRQLFDTFNIAYTHFNRTSDKTRHRAAVDHFWTTLADKGHIYKSKYAGWYCVSDETFITEAQLKENAKNEKVSAESGHPVKWVEEENYMFKLSQFQSDVQYWVKHSQPIQPQKFERLLLHYLSEPFPDISVSRPSHRVSWAIPVPNDPSQTIYVWLDALVNYLTSANYPDPNFTENWPLQMHVIGKDILKFHGIYWPAFLMAAGLELPERLLVHSHWTVDGRKMSKSLKNVIDPHVAAERYTYEGLRYFLLRVGTVHSDGNYSEEQITQVINADLVNTLGNLLSRVCSQTVNKSQIVPVLNMDALQAHDSCAQLLDKLNQLADVCAAHMDVCNFYKAIDPIILALKSTNGMLQDTKFWLLTNSPADADRLNAIFALTFESLRVCTTLLQPIIPNMADRVLSTINVEHRTWDDAKPRIESSQRSLNWTNKTLMERIKEVKKQ